jgi:hypothetical protein
MKIAFYKKKLNGLHGVYSSVVRWWDDGPYSHCELVFDNGLSASSSLMDGGVRFKEIDFSNDAWDFLDVPLSVSQETAHLWFLAHEGCKYDLLGNLGFVFRRGLEDQSKWFCSEAVAASLGFSEAWRLSPNGLYQIIKSLNTPNPS